MKYNQRQEVEGDFEVEGLTISYLVTWVREYFSGDIFIDSIDEVTVYKGDDELEGYYKEHEEEVDELIKQYAEEPYEWEEPTTADLLEVEAEYEYECANGY